MPCYSMAANGLSMFGPNRSSTTFFSDIAVAKDNSVFDPAAPVKFAAMRIRGYKYILYIRYLRGVAIDPTVLKFAADHTVFVVCQSYICCAMVHDAIHLPSGIGNEKAKYI